MIDSYRSLDLVVVRVPLLPFEVFDGLGDPEDSGDGTARHLTDEVRTAIAVGSTDFDQTLQATPDSRAVATLRRYLTRMSTRPTPFGLFAGVGLAHLSDHTDLMVASAFRPRRTRLDAGLLDAFTVAVQQDSAIRSSVMVVANFAARWRADRIVLAERAAGSSAADSGSAPVAVSVRATGVVRRALAAARTPIRYADLVDRVIVETPGADRRRVEALLDELCRQTLLLSDLRPPPTRLDRAEAVRGGLSAIGSTPATASAPTASERLGGVLAAVHAFDAGPPTVDGFRAVAGLAAALAPGNRPPLQVDSGVGLLSTAVAERVAQEAVRGAGLLLRMSPTPHGPGHLAAYRRAFESRFGARGVVGILEMVDPVTGLGPLPAPAAGRLDSKRSAERSATLMSLAVSALRDGTPVIDLDEDLLRRLETADQHVLSLPPSVELTVFVASTTRSAIDRGEFELVIGPNVGSGAAGRMLGRFADLVPGATNLLERIADEETAVVPGTICAELSYAPRSARQLNVATRPNVRTHEIALGVVTGKGPEHSIPLDELVVLVRDGRFRLRWSRTGQEVVVTAGHMLNPAGAPALARLLSEIGRDGKCQLGAFGWGPAVGFPYLPRVRSGRVVLSLAQWRVGQGDLGGPDTSLDRCTQLLGEWRTRWRVPARVAVASGDRRHALDLERPSDVAELRGAIRTARAPLTLTELYPDTPDLWLTDDRGRRYTAEFVVPLIRRTAEPEPPGSAPRPPTAPDRRPPGSDWLFVKLYLGSDLEDDLLAGPVRDLVASMYPLRITGAFFLRYDDPERHIRLRFPGPPDLLSTTVLPTVTRWANDLMSAGLLRRWAIDTYERELDRYGGPVGTDAVERFFAADSAAVLDLLADLADSRADRRPVPLAVLTVDALLDGFGLTLAERARWCVDRGGPRRESGADYRAFKAELRPQLSGSDGPDDPIRSARTALRRATESLRAELDRPADSGALTCAPTELLSSLTHLHLNRLTAASRATERRIYGLLGRLSAGIAAPRGRR